MLKVYIKKYYLILTLIRAGFQISGNIFHKMDNFIHWWKLLHDSNGCPIMTDVIDNYEWNNVVVPLSCEQLFLHVGRHNKRHVSTVAGLMVDRMCSLSQFEFIDIMMGSLKFSDLYERVTIALKASCNVDILPCPPLPDLRATMVS